MAEAGASARTTNQGNPRTFHNSSTGAFFTYLSPRVAKATRVLGLQDVPSSLPSIFYKAFVISQYDKTGNQAFTCELSRTLMQTIAAMSYGVHCFYGCDETPDLWPLS